MLWMLLIVLLCMGVGMIRCVGDYPRVGALRLKAITGFDPFYCSFISLEEH